MKAATSCERARKCWRFWRERKVRRFAKRCPDKSQPIRLGSACRYETEGRWCYCPPRTRAGICHARTLAQTGAGMGLAPLCWRRSPWSYQQRCGFHREAIRVALCELVVHSKVALVRVPRAMGVTQVSCLVIDLYNRRNASAAGIRIDETRAAPAARRQMKGGHHGNGRAALVRQRSRCPYYFNDRHGVRGHREDGGEQRWLTRGLQ